MIACNSAPAQQARRRFAIGEHDFLLDGQPFVIRSGEMHAARVPPEYWRHRLEMVKAMGCNTVCAYLFWNLHEPRPGELDFTGAGDAATYCRLAQEAGLWVILRPGPYSCAEWEFGGFPWWLTKTPDLKVRTSDPRYLAAVRRYLLRVGQELAPLQVTHGGPILMVQVENEYGSYGSDRAYIGAVRDDLRDGGFNVPMFTCDGPTQLANDTRDDLFCVVNFGGNPAGNFKALRAIRPTGPLMCGEYYPGWFDQWGHPHHTGAADRIIGDLKYMLDQHASFSIYMVHGGTSFGFWAGANSPPYAPQTTSYDYDAPIDEAGRTTPKFHAIRALFEQYLQPGETLPEVPEPPMPFVELPPIEFREWAPLFAQLGSGHKDDRPRSMEQYDQATGCILYRTTLAAGPGGKLVVRDPHDYVQVFLDGRRVATLDRRHRGNTVQLPAREIAQRLDLLVEAMGRVNYGADIFDRKGITERVELVSADGTRELKGWEVFNLPLDDAFLRGLKFSAAPDASQRPAVFRATFNVAHVGDSFLDLRTWHKGAVWVNGHALGRYWNIGPQQTLYMPGCWLKQGENEILVLDVTGDAERRTISGLSAPLLNEVRPDPLAPQPHRKPGQTLRIKELTPAYSGEFAAGKDWQQVRFAAPVHGRYLCLQALNSQPGDPFTTCAELALLGEDGAALPRETWRVLYADSEELNNEDGSATNVLDGDPDTFWHTEWGAAKPAHPHQLVIDLGHDETITGLRYLPRQDSRNGRVKQFEVYLATAVPPGT